MPRKVILIADPGIDTAFAVALALHDPNLDVIGLIPCGGNVPPAQACANVQMLITQFDPPKWPRTAAAVPVEYDRDGTALHGPDGLGGLNLPMTERLQQIPGDKVVAELVRAHPREVTIICLGPATTVASAFARDPELPGLVDRLILVGGVWKDPGNAGPVSEFHFSLDPESARRAVRSGAHPTIVPLDVTRKLVLSPSELLDLPNPDSRTCQFLRQIVPFGIRASSNLYGIEGFHLKDVLGVAAVALPGSVTTEDRYVDVETLGELTRGMLVVDDRKSPAGRPNALVGVEAALGEIRQYMARILKAAP
ncbi:MAG: nucleoside hydrolase [Fimbriiglobus sp.]